MASFELPVVKKKDVTTDVRNNYLQVSGHSSISESLVKEGYALRERRFGRFSRAITLLADTKPEDIKVRMENGVLTVKLPGTQPEQEAKRITIS